MYYADGYIEAIAEAAQDLPTTAARGEFCIAAVEYMLWKHVPDSFANKLAGQLFKMSIPFLDSYRSSESKQ